QRRRAADEGVGRARPLVPDAPAAGRRPVGAAAPDRARLPRRPPAARRRRDLDHAPHADPPRPGPRAGARARASAQVIRPALPLTSGPRSIGGNARRNYDGGARAMASVEQRNSTDQTTAEVVNTVVDDGARLGVRRFSTIPGRNGPAFEQRGVEFPKFWSQTATNIVAQKYFRGRLSSPERESSVRQ